jgi:hypothetical protein
MRAIHALPIVAAMLLGACGSGDADADNDGKVSAQEAASEAQSLVQPRPGQYRASIELLEFDAPGMPPEAKQQMQQLMSGAAQANTFCMTKEDAEKNGAEQMVKDMAQGDCTTKSFNVSGNTVVADMQCPSEGGGMSTVRMEGEMGAEGSTMTMTMNEERPGIGATSMKMRVKSERIGECS